MKVLLFPLLTFLFLSTAKAQSYYFKHYQVENGLSNNAVISSLQDHQGFLWFGTKDGLNRFDGYSFKVFRNEASDSNSIGSNYIYSLYETRSNILWVGCDRGLFAYDANAENFRRVYQAPLTEVIDIQEDGGGALWFISRQVLYYYHPATGIFKAYDQPHHLRVTSVCALANGDLWVSSVDGTLHRLLKYGPSATGYNVLDSTRHSVNNWIEKIYDAGRGNILVGTSRQGARIFDTRTNSNRNILSYSTHEPEIFVRDFIRQSENECWIATESGIYIYNESTGQAVNLRKDYNNPYSISDNAVYTFCRDKEGGIWAGTYFGGMNYYPRQYTSFRKYFPEKCGNSISGNAVREIVRDETGNLWIGTEDAGLNKLDLSSGSFSHYTSAQPNRVSPSNIHGLLVHGHELWVGTFHRGLDVLDTRTGKLLRHYSAATHNLRSEFVYCFLKTRQGRIIVGTDQGLSYYNEQTDNFDLIDAAPINFYTILYEDRLGNIWAGTYADGVYWFNPHTGHGGHFGYEPGKAGSLAANRVNWVFEDSRQQLWIATEGGLCKLNPATHRFTNYTTKEGFPSNIMYAVLEDRQQHFWVSSSKGLVRFTPDNGNINVFTRSNGLLSDQFNYNSAYKDPLGRMYFGGVKGLISFHPDEFIPNNFVLPVYITGFQVYDQELAINKAGSPLHQSITFTRSITLAHNQSSFSIDFAALSYTSPDMTEYAYRMDGLNKDWSYLKTNRKAYFTELSPGTYTFTVKARTGGGQWHCQPASLEIRILPPIWASPWAYLLYAVVIIATVLLLLSNYHRRTEAKNRRKLQMLEHEKEKEIYQSKIEFFTNVAHEIRTPLTLIKGPMEKIMKQIDAVPQVSNNLHIMKRNTDRLLDLTTQLLDFRKTETNGFSLNFVQANIAHLLTDAYVRFKPTAEQKKLAFNIAVPPQFNAYVDKEAFNKILSNLLDNAVKYAAGRVDIRLEVPAEQEEQFRVTVSNDGYLIPAEMKEKIFESFFRIKENDKQSGTGIGLALARSLAELHRGTLYLKTPMEDLNVFVLELPIHQKIEFNLSR
ncbi:MAG: two-component regulator propeller domain-containing protein [Candidatus Pseudobacter hemicellulosilyticus]|uniref:histidine kinase n=1 Tax=Candidatus Pseudobacter hemicellulosilyticus TaxID=3121375 RepID=A0AAJ5WWN0_9BACT|nr:MAG: two-component regulator propeller domain-containing protein [Pseudobacter sp.]